MSKYPASYFNPNSFPIGKEGYDLLQANGTVIRPQIGGKSKSRRSKSKSKSKNKRSKSKKMKGGFIPSVMGGFTQAAATYITPMALFAGYKMMKHPTKMKRMGKRK